MLTFKFKNQRTNNINKLNGMTIPDTFNASSKKSIYKNVNSRFEMTNGLNKGCGKAGCGKQCCLLSFIITNITHDDYEDNSYNNLFKIGKQIFDTNTNKNIGTIDAVVFPYGSCQDLVGILNCVDSWPLTVQLIVKSSGSCVDPTYTGGYITIDYNEIVGNTFLEGYDIVGSSSRVAHYRNPIFGYRKVLANTECCLINCSDSSLKHNVKPTSTNDIYKDMHAKYTGKTNLLKNKKVPVTTNNNVCYSSIIRSGMQPKPDIYCVNGKTHPTVKCDTSKCIIKNNYSYDYRQYLNNKSGKGWKRSQEKFFPMRDGVQTTLGGVSNGNCQTSEYSKGPCSCIGKMTGKTHSKTIYKPNNRKFSSQGAVSAGSRLERLKLDTLRATNSKCDECKTIKVSNGTCTKTYKYGKGPYFAGKPRFTGWMYNSKHKEKVCLSQMGQQPFGIPQLTNKKRQTSNQFRTSFPGKR
jgi:hypothetical protein